MNRSHPAIGSLLCLLSVFSVCSVVNASSPTYWKDVRPVLRKSCTVCHNPRQLAEKEISGGIVLDTYDKTLKHLKPGKYKFFVQATDAFGNVDVTPAHKKVRVLPES